MRKKTTITSLFTKYLHFHISDSLLSGETSALAMVRGSAALFTAVEEGRCAQTESHKTIFVTKLTADFLSTLASTLHACVMILS